MSGSTRLDRRARPWLLAGWLAAALLTLALTGLGWWDANPHLESWRRLENALFLALRAFGFDETYDHLEGPRADIRLIVGRWTGLALVLSAVVAGGVALFRTQIAAVAAALRRGHTLIVGDHEMAAALVVEAVRRGLKVVHLSAGVSEPEKAGRLITLPRAPGEDPLAAGRGAQARRIVIAESDLGASIETALQALSQLADPAADPSRVAVHLDDPIVAERIHHAPGGANLYAFSEAQAVARAVMLRHPPFLLARRLGAAAVHILIEGFDSVGQALVRDLVLNNLVSDLGAPHVTILQPRAQEARNAFLHLHPELDDGSRLVFCEDLEADSLGPDRPPVCAAYICLRDSAEGLSAAISLSERAGRRGQIQGPIFVRLRSGGPLRPAAGVAHLQPRQICSFGALSDAASGSLALADDPDADAKQVHQVYAEASGSAAPPWATLPEELRVSNRRVVSHIPAKLASLGFDLEPWLTLPEGQRRWPPRPAAGERLFRDEADRLAAARLEHERWMADRRVNGWRYGPKRDNERKIQPYLIPFDDLPEAVQAYDYAVVDWLGRYLEGQGEAGALKRPAAAAKSVKTGRPSRRGA